MGLSHALDQLCTRRGSVTEDREQSVNRAFLNWNLSPEQMKKIDNLTKQMLNQEKFWEVKAYASRIVFVSFMELGSI